MAQRPFVIGRVAGAHGVKGELKVFPLTDDINRFELLKEISIETADSTAPYKIDKVWYHKKFVMLKLREVNTMDDALALKGADIKIDVSLALPLSENQYYVRDLLEMDVYTESGDLLGKITDVIETGANDVYEVTNDGKKLYIPAIKDCVKEVDTPNKKMIIRLMEGLI